jgi:hypothetical protein
MLLNGGEESDLDEGIKTFTVRSGSGKGRPLNLDEPSVYPTKGPYIGSFD